MNTQKTHIYFVPGLAASSKIFEHLTFDDSVVPHFLEWQMPLHKKESIEEYAKRFSEQIVHENPILVGLSFGGIIVQEIAKHIKIKKIILISSIKSNTELPTRLTLVKNSKVYKLFPTKIVSHIEDYEKYFLGDYLKKRAELYKIYLSVRDPLYLEWAIYNVLHWKQNENTTNLTHIHGTKDEVFPIKNIEKTITIENGTHVMILTKAKTISTLIHQEVLAQTTVID